jgi:hypothetical protein
MAFSRKTSTSELPQGAALTRAMVGIGMVFATDAETNPNVEDTLIAASIEGMERDDLRVLSVLTTWLGVHHPWINVDRLTRAVADHESTRVQAYWAAVATWLQKDRRFSRIARLYSGARIDALRVGGEFQVRRRGEDERFADTCLRVPASVLRDRAGDVLDPSELAKRHDTYRQRILMGPSYRADMWAALDAEPSLSASELARQTYGSFATAWQVKKDFQLLAA